MCLCFILQKLKDQCTIFESDISICVAQSQKTFGNQGLLTEVKKISPLINDWENNIAYWEEAKQSEALAGKCDSFHTVNSWWVWDQTAQPQENVAIYILMFGNSISSS